MAKNVYICIDEDVAEVEEVEMELDNHFDEDYNVPYEDDFDAVINTGHIFGGESIFDDR